MKFSKNFLIFALSFSLVSISFLSYATQTVFAQQDSRVALQRGYRTGYSDGYMSGYRDAIENAAKSYARHGEYAKADRAFSKDYGSVEDYRDGYQQGFESGYDTGFEKRSFDATIPSSLNKRGVVAVKTTVAETATTKTTVEEKPTETVVETVVTNKPEEPVATNPVEEKTSETTTTAAPTTNTVEQSPIETTTTNSNTTEPPALITTTTESVNSAISGETIISIPSETELIVELVDDIDTERNKEGDRFQARIVSPNELNGAIIEGRISKIQKPGRIKRRAEMLLSFDRVVLSQNRWSNFNAILTEVLPVKGDNVRNVDAEGTAVGRSSIKDDSVKVGATTGTGLVIGAIAGGPVGAALLVGLALIAVGMIMNRK